MRSKLQKNRIRSFTISFVSRFLAVFILSSFAVTLLPLTGSSAQSMACCIGKLEGHCNSGLKAHKPAPPPPSDNDPMCGLKSQPLTAESLDAVTVTADPVQESEAHDAKGNAFKHLSVGQHCHMDCGACATSASRHKRQKDAVPAKLTHAPATIAIAHVENWAPIFSSNQNWTRISPRGPPARG